MVTSYGVREQASAESPLERQVEEIRLLGFTKLSAVRPSDAMPDIAVSLDRLYEQQTRTSGGEAALHQIKDAYVARLPLAEDLAFLELARAPSVLALVRALLGDFALLQQQNGVLNPGAEGAFYQTGWHRDLPYQHFVSSHPIAVSALWMIDGFREDNGATWVLPSSHKIAAFPSESYVAKQETQVIGEPGDVLVFDSMLYHRAGANRSARPRRGLNNVYALPILAQQINIPSAMPVTFTPTLEERVFLGYDAAPAPDAHAWRQRRRARFH